MFLREAPTQTLTTVLDKLDSVESAESAVCLNTQVELVLTDDEPVVRFGDQTTFEVPATAETISALGKWLTVPHKFLHRLGGDLQQHLLTGLLRAAPGTMLIRWNDHGIVEVRDPSTRVIDPRFLIETATSVIAPNAPVVDFWSTADDFRLDTIVPEGFDHGWGGDLPTATSVGDITGGGIRIGQDRKHNLAPWVSPYLYRLACTNGYEMEDPGLKVDARGSTIEQVMSEFHDACERAFSRVEADIAAFYDMRNQPVDNAERHLVRIAEEQGLPERTIVELVRRAPAMIEGDQATMFDVVNVITNQANDPGIVHRAGVRRNLEIAGGEIVTEHVDRCGHCHSRLSA